MTAWASKTFPLVAWSDFPLRVPRTWPSQPSRVARPGAVSSAVCVCPPPLGKVWLSAWAHRVPQCPQPVGPLRRSAHSTQSRSQQFHQHPVVACTYHSGLHHLSSPFFIFVCGRSLKCQPSLPIAATSAYSLKETIGIGAYPARPTKGEAASPWRKIST